jgi:predicted Zn-dependent protease
MLTFNILMLALLLLLLYRRALAVQPNNSAAVYGSAVCAWQAGQYDTACQLLTTLAHAMLKQQQQQQKVSLYMCYLYPVHILDAIQDKYTYRSYDQ